MMLEFKNPIPVLIKETKQEAYAIYAVNGGMFENDIWAVVVCETSEILHCRTDQLLMYKNHTFGIKEKKKEEPMIPPAWSLRE